MDFTRYLSYFHPNEEIGGKYQIPIEMNDIDSSKSEEDINSILKWSFYEILHVPPSYILSFLNFHYEQFANKNLGQEVDFFFFLENCIEDIPIEVSMKFQWGFKPIEIKKRQKIISDWIDKKKMELESESVSVQEQTKISHSKQMILLDEFGILKHLDDQFNLTNEKKAYLISLIIGKNEQNTREFLTYGTNKPENTSRMKQKHIYLTPENQTFATSVRSKLNLP